MKVAVPLHLRLAVVIAVEDEVREVGSVGNQTLWVGLPAYSTLHSDTPSADPIMVRFPWWRLKAGRLTITALRLDGTSAGFSADPGTVSEYGDSGFAPPN